MNVNNENPGVADYESQPRQYSDGMTNLNLSDTTYDQRKMCEQEVEEHILGLIMAHQYSMKKVSNFLVRRERRLLLRS